MSKTHWKQLVNMDYIGAYALPDGNDLTLTIKEVVRELVTGNSGRKEQCMVMYFQEPQYKPMILNRTNAKTISSLFGSNYVEDWAGKRITLYGSTTRFGPDTVECLRIRPYAPPVAKQTVTEQPKQTVADRSDLICEKCGKPIVGAYGKSADIVAEQTKAKYGKRLCAGCAREANTGA